MRQAGGGRVTVGLAACAAAAALVLAGAAGAQQQAPAVAPGPDDALTLALESGRLSEPEYALERARSLFDLGAVRREFGAVERAGAREATLLLRDLAVRLHRLSGQDRAAAEAILARPPDRDVPFGYGWHPVVGPADVARECSAVNDVCVHWVSAAGHPDAPDPTDGDSNGVPDWVDLTLATLDEVWTAQVDALGYRPPLSDAGVPPDDGGDGRLDVYLDDLGADGIFGYCSTDPATDVFELAVPVYCVLDNDFADFGAGQTPDDFLRVTVAHELFHAVQAAYDFLEDLWLLEGTAANIEETIYPDVNDNVSFLSPYPSPFTQPHRPLDRAGVDGSEYGAWIFWRFLEEKVAGGDSTIIREIWEGAEGEAAFSLVAARRELARRGLSFPDALARFARANRFRDYADGALYPATRRTKVWGLGQRSPTTGWRSWRIDHLAARHFTFKPGPTATANGRLGLRIRLPQRGARATLVLVRADGSTVTRYLQQNARGVARITNRFGRGTVKRIDLVLTNGSTRVRSCYTLLLPPYHSCYGRPLDDGQVYTFRARVVP